MGDNSRNKWIGPSTRAFMNIGKGKEWGDKFSQKGLENSKPFKKFFENFYNIKENIETLNLQWGEFKRANPKWAQCNSIATINTIPQNISLNEIWGEFIGINALAMGWAWYNNHMNKKEFEKDAQSQIGRINAETQKNLWVLHNTLVKIAKEINKGIQSAKSKQNASSTPQQTNEGIMDTMKNAYNGAKAGVQKAYNGAKDFLTGSAYDNVGFEIQKFQPQLEKIENFYNTVKQTMDQVINAVESNPLDESVSDSTMITSYTHFALSKRDGRIYYGWDYSDIEPDTLKDNVEKYFASDLFDDGKNPRNYRIVTRGYLKSRGIDAGDLRNAWGDF